MKGFITALALVMALLLTGCGGRGSVNSNGTANNTNAGTQVGDSTPGTGADYNNTAGDGTTGDNDLTDSDGHYEADRDGVVDDDSDNRTDRDGDLSDDLKDAVDDTADAAQDVTDGVVDGARDVTNGVVEGAQDVADGIIDGADNAGDAVADGTNTARNNMNNTVNGTGTGR